MAEIIDLKKACLDVAKKLARKKQYIALNGKQKERSLFNLMNTYDELKEIREEILGYGSWGHHDYEIVNAHLNKILSLLMTSLDSVEWVLNEHVWFDPENL